MSSVTLTWNPPADDGGSPVTQYQVTLSANGDPEATVSIQTNTTIPINGLLPATPYTFRVRAKNEGSTYGPAAEVSTRTVGVVPSEMQAPTQSSFTTNSVDLSWVAPNYVGDPVDYYVVSYYWVSDPATVFQFTSTETSTTVSGLLPFTMYRFHVAAVNVVGTGPDSAPLTVTTRQLVPPNPVQNLRVDYRTSSALRVSWDPLVHSGYQFGGYRVTFGASSGGPSVVELAGATSYARVGLSPATSYDFTVMPLNTEGVAGPSAEVTFATLRPAPNLSSAVASDPDNLDAVFSAGDVIILTFDLPTNQPPVATQEELDELLEFSPSVDFEAISHWSDASTLEISIADPGTMIPQITLQQIQVKSTSTLMHADGESDPPSSVRILTGNWGTNVQNQSVNVTGSFLVDACDPLVLTAEPIKFTSPISSYQWEFRRNDGGDVNLPGLDLSSASLTIPAEWLPPAGYEVRVTVTDTMSQAVASAWFPIGMRWGRIQLETYYDTSGNHLPPSLPGPVSPTPESSLWALAVFVPASDDPPQLKECVMSAVECDLLVSPAPFDEATILPGGISGVQSLVSGDHAIINLDSPGGSRMLYGPQEYVLRFQARHTMTGQVEYVDLPYIPAINPSEASPPEIVDAWVSSSLSSVTLEFNHPTNTPSLSPLASIFADSGRFGTGAVANWINSKELVIQLGSGPSLLFGDQVTVLASAHIQNEIGDVDSTSISPGIRPQSLSGIIPNVTLFGPASIGPCDDLAVQTTTANTGLSPTFVWSCSDSSILPAIPVTTSTKQFIAPAALLSPGTYTFTVRVRNAFGIQSDFESLTVSKAGFGAPQLQAVSPQTLRVSPGQAVQFRGQFTPVPCDSRSPGVILQWMPPAEVPESTTVGSTSPVLSVSAQGTRELLPGQSYLFRLRATDVDSGLATDLDFNVTINQPPQFGIVFTEPYSGFEQLTCFNVTTTGWSDPDGDAISHYEFFIRQEDGSEVILDSESAQGCEMVVGPHYSGPLPRGLARSGGVVMVGVRVSDDFGPPAGEFIQAVLVQSLDFGLRPALLDGLSGSIIPIGTEVASIQERYDFAPSAYAFVSGDGDDDNGLFEIVNAGDHYSVRNLSPIDLTAGNRFMVRISVVGGTYAFEREAIILLERGGIDSWRNMHFFSDLSDPRDEASWWGDSADANQDGFANFWHFLLGLGPFDRIDHIPLTIVFDTGDGFCLDLELTDDLQIEVEGHFSDHPAFGTFSSAVPIIVPQPNGRNLFRCIDPIGDGSGARFGRMMIYKRP